MQYYVMLCSLLTAIIIRLPARPLYGYNIVDYSDEMIIRNARGRGIWLRPDMPDIVLPEQREPDQPRKKRMFSPNIDADTILQIKKDLEKNEPKAKGGSGTTTNNVNIVIVYKDLFLIVH